MVREETDLRQKLHKVNLCGRIKWNEKSIKYWSRTEKKNYGRLKEELI